MEETFDVVVVGGGSAGCAAAVSAARLGARVLLIERHGFLGGAGTASLVHTFCGLYHPPASPDDQPMLAHPGLPSELAREMICAGVAEQPLRLGRVFVLPHHPVMLAGHLDKLCAAEKNIELRLHTEVIAVALNGRRLSRLEILCRGSRSCVKAASFVDASGDAVLAEHCGQPWEMAAASELQRPAYIVTLQGVAADALTGDGPVALAGHVALATRSGRLPKECLGAHFRKSRNMGEVFVTLDLPGHDEGTEFDPLSSASLTALEKTGRAAAAALVGFLRETHRAFTHAHVSSLPVRAGIRESRRWTGEYTLTEQNILDGAAFADAVAVASWPIELRETTKGPRLLHSASPRSADIPLRSLRAAALDNVFIAGRCISAKHRAQASIRVMGIALATGQAAGVAAAFASSTNTATTTALAAQVKLRLQTFLA